MGRQSLGSTNLKIRDSLYYTCFRSRSGGGNGFACNFSMSNYIRTSIEPQLYNGNSGSTNSNFGTYICNKGFTYGIALKNDSPARGTSSIRLAGVTQIASSSSNSAVIGRKYNALSASYSYLQIRFSATSGNQFDGWRTGNNSGGGTLITTSTSYNAYYTNTYIINHTIWYANTSASRPPRYSTAAPFGLSSFEACNSGNTTTVYVTTGASFLSATALYASSTGNTKSPAGYYSNGFQYRFWNGSSFPFPQAFCGF